ncbi:signal peptidase I [Candidatus Curtissbacteria bacterium RIFCSPLOWO2_01_FULL_41_18]|uniref:Signal peptidase I n=1 Tax=Candidatus Curtissbacteria bacterium RIFCSPLOWO2_01_FULL_41_18 TaxID=1797727 RepID=A0A1F5HN72_9BACT|nr:MAG: signal peptidase I [Candidatus Curtissbacteria bacterium RIFCSPLOWO2_01_FULL_41_18]
MKLIFKSANFGLSLLLVLAAIAIAYIAIPAFGNKALIVRSGSMQPAIKVGDLVVVTSQTGLITPQSTKLAKYKVGDVIAFKSDENSKLFTTHRIVGKEIKDGKVFYQTKGDANNAADNNLVAEENIIGKSTFRLPYFGRLFAFAKSNVGFPILVIFPALLVIILEIINIVKELRLLRHPEPFDCHSERSEESQDKLREGSRFFGFQPQNDSGNSPLRSNNNLPILRVLLPLVIGIMFFHNSFAFFSDTATSINNTFQASQIFTNHIVISEVQIDGGLGQANDNDFIELYNPTSSPFNLNGYRLVKRTGNAPNDTNIFTFTSSHIVPAHGYFLWANDDFTTIAVIPDVTSSDTLAASNSVALRQGNLNTGTIIDALSWDPGASSLKEGTQFNSNPGANQSMERKALSTSTASSMAIGGADEFKGNGFDSNNNATDFVLRTVSQPQNSSSSPEAP